MDEFWIEPLTVDGDHAAIRASFNEFTVTILVERKDGAKITKEEARAACDAVVARLPTQTGWR